MKGINKIIRILMIITLSLSIGTKTFAAEEQKIEVVGGIDSIVITNDKGNNINDNNSTNDIGTDNFPNNPNNDIGIDNFSNNPKTGDESMKISFVLAVLSLTMLIIIRKKEKNEELSKKG
ncbi:MAG: LPXTG cell wall anchor domain-containing protein [Clostridium sp.]